MTSASSMSLKHIVQIRSFIFPLKRDRVDSYLNIIIFVRWDTWCRNSCDTRDERASNGEKGDRVADSGEHLVVDVMQTLWEERAAHNKSMSLSLSTDGPIKDRFDSSLNTCITGVDA